MELKNGSGRGRCASSPLKSIYARGADDGFWLGIYISAIFGLSVVALSIPAINIAVGAMALLVPFIVYFLLRRTHVAAHGLTSFSALWMQGIVMFACGSLVFGLACFVYLRWIDPGFMGRVLQMGIDYYSSVGTEASRAVADEFTLILESGSLPSAMNVVMGWMWLGMFSGSLLSMFVAGVVRMRKVKISRQDADD